MSTSTQIDRGDWIETITGEPAWDNPTEWRRSDVEWKPGTAQYEVQQALDGFQGAAKGLGAGIAQAQSDLANWATLTADEKDAAVQRVIQNLAAVAMGVAQLGVVLGHLDPSILT